MKKSISKALNEIWESYNTVINKLIRSEKAFVFNVATVLLIFKYISGEIWLAVALGLMGANVIQKTKWMNNKTTDFEG